MSLPQIQTFIPRNHGGRRINVFPFERKGDYFLAPQVCGYLVDDRIWKMGMQKETNFSVGENELISQVNLSKIPFPPPPKYLSYNNHAYSLPRKIVCRTPTHE